MKPLCWVAAVAATGCTNGTFHDGVGTGTDRRAESVDPQSDSGIAQRWQGAGMPSPAERHEKVEQRKKLEEKLPAGTKDREQEMVENVRRRGVLRALSTGATSRRLFTSAADSRLDNALSTLQGDRMLAGDGTGGGTTRGGGTLGGGSDTGMFGGASRDAGQVGGVGEAAGVRADIGRRGERRARAELTYGSSDVEGSLTQKQIEDVVKAHAAGIKYCYESELVRAPRLEGKVVATWWIDPEGLVLKAVVDNSTTGNANLEECVLRQIRRWRFPRPGGGTAVARFPFIFSTPPPRN